MPDTGSTLGGEEEESAGEHVQDLRQRVMEFEHQLELMHEQTGAAWGRFNEAQMANPQIARLSYEEWFATVWGPHISVAQVQLTNARTAFQLAQVRKRQQRSTDSTDTSSTHGEGELPPNDDLDRGS